jgi:hypothetical protein
MREKWGGTFVLETTINPIDKRGRVDGIVSSQRHLKKVTQSFRTWRFANGFPKQKYRPISAVFVLVFMSCIINECQKRLKTKTLFFIQCMKG